MSNLHADPDEVLCTAEPGSAAAPLEVMTPRDVPLGGPRAMRVRRTLPQRSRSLIGAWCFVDHYGPDDVATSGGMVVAPHPHIGLQTVSWLFTGEVEHRDSAGHRALVRPGELNLMTAGRGISHSENSTPGTAVLHGAQLWVALPADARDVAPAFEHFAPAAVRGEGHELRVFLGELAGSRSPVVTHTPLLGAEVLLDAGAELRLDVDPAFEHGVLVDLGAPADALLVEGAPLERHELGHLAPGRSSVTLRAGAEPVRLLLLGGPPFEESIVMWWNFVGRSHEEVAAARDDWQQQVAGGHAADGRFGVVAGEQERIPAPELPHVRLRERR
ncbi:pirin family protein [Nocardioides sp. TRM66260-LWL]|uniref:pirin family protein n=1 Tax=Nocardioides sp. TRM66260-LWL TaxID=2874478 RepID=UPI001CC3C04E|nr:pirin family protein [Nocardioides sp. TRM66260-LWL]MBZ5735255.1 pirin family protein [Nocardioides sp. TRM66260-LWL]